MFFCINNFTIVPLLYFMLIVKIAANGYFQAVRISGLQ